MSGSKLKLSDNAWRYLEWFSISLEKRSLSPDAHRAYLTLVGSFLEFALKRGFDFDKLLQNYHSRDEAVLEYKVYLLDDLKLREGAINASLVAIYQYFEHWGRRATSAGLTRTTSTEPKIFTAEDIQKLCRVLPNVRSEKDRAVFALFLYTGIRLSECAKLDTNDVTLSSPALLNIRMDKGSSRTLSIDDTVSKYLDEWLNYRNRTYYGDNDALFITRDGQRLTVYGLDAIIKKIGFKANLVVSARALRNTFFIGQCRSSGSSIGDLVERKDFSPGIPRPRFSVAVKNFS